MSHYDFDLLTIGGGSGGVRLSRWASSKYSKKVAICEKDRMGGTCVIRGCIPKKLMLIGSALPHQLAMYSSYGWQANKPLLNWDQFNSQRDKEISRLEQIYKKLLKNAQVKILEGKARILAPHTVQVGDKTYTAKHIVIASGGKPFLPQIPGSEHGISSDQVFHLPKLPSSLVIMGGGYIGLEFASIFNALGSKVKLIIRRDHILKGFDQDMRQFLQEELIKRGITVIPNESITEIKKDGDLFQVFGKNSRLEKDADCVLFATGRVANTDSLGLENTNIKLNQWGEIQVSPFFETAQKGIYAIGDCAGTPYQLTPVAIEEAMKLTKHLFDDHSKAQKMDYNHIPSAVFSHPPLATVGLSEEEAKKQGYKVRVFLSQFKPLKYTLSKMDVKTLMKLVVDKASDQVLGACMVGDESPEIIQGLSIALKAGVTKSQVDATVGLHPTSAEEFVSMREEKT